MDCIAEWLRLKIKAIQSSLSGRISNATSASSSKMPRRRQSSAKLSGGPTFRRSIEFVPPNPISNVINTLWRGITSPDLVSLHWWVKILVGEWRYLQSAFGGYWWIQWCMSTNMEFVPPNPISNVINTLWRGITLPDLVSLHWWVKILVGEWRARVGSLGEVNSACI